MNPETQVHVAVGPSFLGLPPEVRNMIYRLLLVADQTLGTDAKGGRHDPDTWACFGEYGLHPAILRVCSQMHREASPVLNGENTFGINFWGEDGSWHGERLSEDEFDSGDDSESSIFFMNKQLSGKSDWGEDNGKANSLEGCNEVLDTFQRFEIVLNEVSLAVETEVRNFCYSVLLRMPALQHVCVRIESERFYETLFAPFGMLRNMRSVAFHGVPLPFAERLKGLMLGNTPSDNLEEMYRLLKKFVRDHNGPRESLRDASIARAAWDVQMFKKLRSRILSKVRRRMARSLSHLYDYDAKSVENPQATIEEDYYDDCKIAEDHGSEIEDDDTVEDDDKVEDDH